MTVTVSNRCLKVNGAVPILGYTTLSILAAILAGAAWSDEDESGSRKMNIPYFVYRDVNRNGEYDLADRPYAGQVVILERPDGSEAVHRSNIGGFVNFAMSLDNDAHEISAPGNYLIVAEPASSWTVTSTSASQELMIKALEGSPSGLIIQNSLLPVGVAPELAIRGTLAVPADSDVSRFAVVAQSEAGKTRQVTVSAKGGYTVPADPGVWQLTFTGPNAPVSARTVEITSYPVVVSTVRVGDQLPNGPANETIVRFDDLTHSDTLYKVPNGYANLNWHNWIATHHKFYRGYGYINGTVSGEYLAYNSSGHPAAFTSPTPFDFVRAHVGVAWEGAEQGFVEVTGWRGDEVVYRDRIRATTSGPIQFEAGYTEVTRVEFATEHYWQVLLDDLIVNVADPNP